MNKSEMLEAKKAELAALAPDIENDVEGALEKGAELKSEIEALEVEIKRDEEKVSLLKSIGTAEPIKQEEKDMNDLELFAQKCAEMTDRKTGVSQHIKAATDVVTGVQIADIDREVAPQPTRRAARDLFSVAQISGNAITYFLQKAYEGTPAVTAENAKKPQNSTGFTPVTLALSKIAAYIKETDEIINDAPFLASEVQNSLLYHLGVVEDATLISAVAGTSGILAGTYGAGSGSIAGDFADGILYAIKAVKGNSAYDASAVIVNPADMFALQTAKDSNLQYIGGGYFTGAYGNGQYQPISAIWGVPVFESTAVSAGQALVVAKQAVKVWVKGGVDVKLYEQNEDDALYNRVTLLAEERIACAVKDVNGVYLLSAE